VGGSALGPKLSDFHHPAWPRQHILMVRTGRIFFADRNFNAGPGDLRTDTFKFATEEASMRSFNFRFVSSIVVLAALSATFAVPALARGPGAAGAAGPGASSGGGSSGGGAVTLARQVPRHPILVAPLQQARYDGCQYDYTSRLTWASAGQPCPDTDD
jgi:hypothetical protein